MMKFVENYINNGSMLSLIAITYFIILIIYKIKNINMRSLQNIKIKFTIYKEIFTEKNETLLYIYLKEYVGFSISYGIVKYIHSTKYYDIIPELKDVFPYIEHDPENDKIKLKKCSKQIRIIFIILCIIFLLPFLFSIIINQYENILFKDRLHIIIIGIAFAIIALFSFWNEAGNIAHAIRLVKSLEKREMNSFEKEDTKSPEK